MLKLIFRHQTIIFLLLITLPAQKCAEKPDSPNYNNIFDPSVGFDNIPPIVNIVVTPQSGITGETEFVFDASGSKELEMPNAKLNYRWDFNDDGRWDTPATQEPIHKYIFTEGGGNKSVRLLVRGANNLFTDTSITLFVNSRPTVGLAWMEDFENENLIHFNASTSWDYEDGDNIEYRWDFNNDGSWEIDWGKYPQTENLFTVKDWSMKIEIRDSNHLVAYRKVQRDIPDDYIASFTFNGNAFDESGNMNNGIVENAIPTKDRFGFDNSAYLFNGTDALIRVPHSKHLNLDATVKSYSISLWIKSSNPLNNRLIEKWDEKVETPYPLMIVTSSDDCKALIYDGISKSNIVSMNFGNVWDDLWHHIAYVVDAPNRMVTGYLDGQYVGKVYNNIVSTTANNLDILIGGTRINWNYYRGVIDDVRIYDRVLTENEIFSLYIEEP
jgi:hypothetical protein